MNTTTSTPAKIPALKPGDKVAYSTQFLESIGESYGEVAEVAESFGRGKP